MNFTESFLFNYILNNYQHQDEHKILAAYLLNKQEPKHFYLIVDKNNLKNAITETHQVNNMTYKITVVSLNTFTNLLINDNQNKNIQILIKNRFNHLYLDKTLENNFDHLFYWLKHNYDHITYYLQTDNMKKYPKKYQHIIEKINKYKNQTLELASSKDGHN